MNPFGRLPDLETKHLLLRKPQFFDIDDIYALYSDIAVTRFDGGRRMRHPKEAEEYIRDVTDPFDQQSIRWAVINKSSEKLIGTCGFQNWDRNFHRAEIGGDLAKNYWNQGCATELLQTILPFAFRQMDLNRISALTLPENKPVLSLLKKFGFVKEGVLREYEYWNGRYVDLAMYSLLKKQYKK